MTGHFLKGLVLLLILGLGMTSSYVIDDPNPSDTEMDTVEDLADEMTKLDEMSTTNIDKEQALRRLDQCTRRRYRRVIQYNDRGLLVSGRKQDQRQRSGGKKEGVGKRSTKTVAWEEIYHKRRPGMACSK